MPETAAAPAPEPQAAPQQPQMTRSQLGAFIRTKQQEDFDRNDKAERLAIAKRKSTCGHAGNNPLFGKVFDDPSIEWTLEELKALVPLDHDRLNYEWKNEKKGTEGVFATNRHGLFSIPKPKGRRKPHMTKKAQDIKSASIRIFRKLFEQAGEKLKAMCKTENLEYIGVPDDSLPKLGASAARIAVREVVASSNASRRKVRRRQQFSRKVNAGLITISASEKNYINKGGQFGA